MFRRQMMSMMVAMLTLFPLTAYADARVTAAVAAAKFGASTSASARPKGAPTITNPSPPRHQRAQSGGHCLDLAQTRLLGSCRSSPISFSSLRLTSIPVAIRHLGGVGEVMAVSLVPRVRGLGRWSSSIAPRSGRGVPESRVFDLQPGRWASIARAAHTLLF